MIPMTFSDFRGYGRRIAEYFSEHPSAWFFAGLSVIVWIVFVNAFPAGYHFISADIAQPLAVSERYARLVADTDGRGALWYGLFFLLEKLGLQDGIGLSAYLFLFLGGSYASFRWFVRSVFPDTSKATVTVLSLVYAVNLHTLYLVFSGWFISPSHTLYVFLPALTGLFLAFLRTPSVRIGGYFLLLFFPATMAFVHPEMLVATVVFFVLLTALSAVYGLARFRFGTVVSLGVLAAGMLVLSAYSLPSALMQIRNGTMSTTSESLSGTAWTLQKTSNAVTETLRLLPPSFQDQFPSWFPYGRFEPLQPIFVALTAIPMFLLVWSLAAKKSDRQRKRAFFVGFSLLVVFVALVARVRPPFSEFNATLFALPGMGALRGYERLAVFVPLLLLWVVASLRASGRSGRVLSFVALLAMLLTPAPFFAGKIHLYTSPTFHNDGREDSYTGAHVSDLVRIPGDYSVLARKLNADPGSGKIARLPFSADKDEVGDEYLPEARMRGADVLAPLFDVTLISAGRPYFGQWLFAKSFAESERDPKWILPLFRAANVSHVLFQKDAAEDAREAVEDRLAYLERTGSLVREEESDSFVLYRVSGTVLPRLRIAEESLPLSERPSENLAATSSVGDDSFRAPETVPEGRGMSVSVGKKDSGRFLTLAEPFDPAYGAVLVGSDGAETPLWHIRTDGFLNGWKLPKVSGDATVRIVYYPERFVGVGRTVSLVALSCVIISVMAISLYERRKRTNG